LTRGVDDVKSAVVEGSFDKIVVLAAHPGISSKMKNRYCLAMLITFSIAAVSAKAQTLDDTDILELATSGSLQDIQAAIKQGADVNAMDAGGETPIMYAVEYNQSPEIVTELLKAGADVNAHDIVGVTPLMYAAAYNHHCEVIKILLAAGADAYAHDDAFLTPLMYALDNNQTAEIITVLQEATKDVRARS
jgi:ankyrin repeat protein